MGIGEFVAVDPYDPKGTEKELDFFISRFKGMMDWEIRPNGDVVIQYDSARINEDLIEEVLERNGFRVKHILDLPRASEAQAFKAFHRKDECKKPDV